MYTQWTNPTRELHQAIFSLSLFRREKKKEKAMHALETKVEAGGPRFIAQTTARSSLA
jgi:5,10-methylenetetrahydrofolate reductase